MLVFTLGLVLKIKHEKVLVYQNKKERLEIANKKSLDLDNNSNEVKDIVHNLKNTFTNKDKYVLNKEDKDKIDSLSTRIRFKILCFFLEL